IDRSIAGQIDQTVVYIRISNEGVGPAMIKSMKVTLPRELGGGSHSDWSRAVEILEERGVEVHTYWNYEGGEAVGVQRGRELMQMSLASDSARALLPVIEKIGVDVVYTSIYKEEFTARLR